MTTAIIDYGSGNLHSVAKAFEHAATGLGDMGPVTVTRSPAEIRAAARIVLPGVGAFADCRAGLMAAAGVAEAMTAAVIGDGKPFLGICVGMQLLADDSLEAGRHRGLGWVAGRVQALAPADPALKVPHMGWNDLALTAAGRRHPLFAGIAEGDHGYFVHGYHFDCRDAGRVLAKVDHGGPIVAAIARDNILGVQFHPEKSQALGLRVIANFLGWRP